MLLNITTAVDIMCPLKKYKVAQAKESWISGEILELIKDKDQLLRRAKSRDTQYDSDLARNDRNDVNLQIRCAEANFVQDNLKIH